MAHAQNASRHGLLADGSSAYANSRNQRQLVNDEKEGNFPINGSERNEKHFFLQKTKLTEYLL